MNSNSKDKKRIFWVDFAKLVAILAVLIDHTDQIFYDNEHLAYLTYFSVSLFVLMTGITTYYSLQKNNEPVGKMVLRKCWGIFRPYLVATFIYQLFLYAHWDLETYVKGVINFNMSPPFYYVFLYIQLIIVAPILYKLLVFSGEKKLAWLMEIGYLVVIIIISSYTTRYTFILDIIGGGGKLFGGTFLILLYLGMWFAKYYRTLSMKPIWSISAFNIALVITVVWGMFVAHNQCEIDQKLPFGEGLNPPGLSLCLYAVLLALTISALELHLYNLKGDILRKIYIRVASLGKYTLYIYIYHKLFLDFIFRIFRETTGFAIDNMWVKRVVYLVIMFVVPIFMGKLFEGIHKWLVDAYQINKQ